MPTHRWTDPNVVPADTGKRWLPGWTSAGPAPWITCANCGTHITATNANTLEQEKREHEAECRT